MLLHYEICCHAAVAKACHSSMKHLSLASMNMCIYEHSDLQWRCTFVDCGAKKAVSIMHTPDTVLGVKAHSIAKMANTVDGKSVTAKDGQTGHELID